MTSPKNIDNAQQVVDFNLQDFYRGLMNAAGAMKQDNWNPNDYYATLR